MGAGPSKLPPPITLTLPFPPLTVTLGLPTPSLPPHSLTTVQLPTSSQASTSSTFPLSEISLSFSQPTSTSAATVDSSPTASKGSPTSSSTSSIPSTAAAPTNPPTQSPSVFNSSATLASSSASTTHTQNPIAATAQSHRTTITVGIAVPVSLISTSAIILGLFFFLRRRRRRKSRTIKSVAGLPSWTIDVLDSPATCIAGSGSTMVPAGERRIPNEVFVARIREMAARMRVVQLPMPPAAAIPEPPPTYVSYRSRL
ncbi:hypothetical protein R3P38DRAFT_3090937 [Favolaschia claudopus]|uniref:Uncharacterized protein n=1 Tax=Favolaschia claudopus TaxID=2862362 RepID=A0AAV9ZS38_9AGAR